MQDLYQSQINTSDLNAPQIETSQTKICAKCGLVKNIRSFGSNRSRKDGKNVYCLVCARTVCNQKTRKRLKREKYRRVLKYWPELNARQAVKAFAKLFNSQHKACAICAKSLDTSTAHVDHDHKTGLVRGILCNTCNLGLGAFKDNAEILKNAISYLGVDCSPLPKKDK